MKKCKSKYISLIKPLFLAILSVCFSDKIQAQTYPNQPVVQPGAQRIRFTSVTSSINTGQDYSSWLNDNLDSLVQNVWQNNFIWVDLTLKLQQHSTVSEFKFYDYEGVFTDKPDSIYALNGKKKTFLGTFTGPAYMIFDDLKLATPVQADAIIIRKYSNNIPQKIYIYGTINNNNNANLASIKLSAGSLNPVFNSAVQAYTASVSDTVSVIKLIPTANGAGESIKVNNVAVATGNTVNLPLVTGKNLVTVKVTAQDGVTTNTYTININRASPPASGSLPDTGAIVKIPIDSTRWYMLNNISNGLGGLTDGRLHSQFNTGYGLLFSNYDAYYPVKPGEHIDLYKIRFYSYEGGLGNYPLTVSVIDSLGNKTQVATYVGGIYEAWVGPVPGNSSISLTKPVKNIKYIVLNCWYQFPAEMELYGYYKAPPPVTPVVKKAYPLNQYFGVNAFEWNFEDPNNPLVVNASLLKAIRSFTQVRHYMDWNKLESTRGEYTYDPVHSGGWNYDAIYKTCKNYNLLVLADLKTQPDWLIATYPADQRDAENVPVPYGSDFSDPKSYMLQAKAAFQYAARYGSNAAVSSKLLSVDTSSRWTADPVNTVKKGLGLIKYIECDNERDKWWKGRKGYQTSYEYAANLSAFYDGNKNTMGPGVGVKNADPTMQVVMGGLASADPSYVHGMVEWCRQHRGYHTDGTVNLCWDVINYHLYANNSVNGSNATTGIAPELSKTAKIAQQFIAMSHEYAHDMPVWVTEAGYDANQGSPQKAPAIGDKTAPKVEADWILRTSLLYARSGIARLFYYEAYDDNAANPTQYASSGLINDNKTRRPAADYLYQVNKLFGSYTYKQSLSSSPVVDRYQSDDKQAYVLYYPTQKGQTGSYVLNLGTADSAYLYTPTAGVNDMRYTKQKLANGKLTLNITETPIFVVPSGIAGALAAKALTAVKDTLSASAAFDKTISIYPNPSISYLTIAINSQTQGKVSIKVVDAMGTVYGNYTGTKSAESFSQTINVTRIPMGIYVVQVTQGKLQSVRKVYKSY